MKKIIEIAHEMLKAILTPEDLAVDMTLGRGQDTRFLSPLVKEVVAFDIQEEAIRSAFLEGTLPQNVKLICDSHVNIKQVISRPVKAFIFNLGFLPGGDKTITTQAITTFIALKEALSLLEVHGRIAIVLYPGHPEGAKEACVLEEWLPTLSQKMYEVLEFQYINQQNNPPYLIMIERIAL